MTDKYRPGEEPSRLCRARNWGLRVPLPLPGFLLLLQDPYKGEAKTTLRLALKKKKKKGLYSPGWMMTFHPLPEKAPPRHPDSRAALLFISHLKQTNHGSVPIA